MNLVLLAAEELGDRSRVTLDDRRADHIRRVLKGQPGQTLRVGVVDGPVGQGVIESVDAQCVVMSCHFEPDVPARSPVSLLLAVPRPKVLRRLWSQLSSLGVDRILLSNAWKVPRAYFDARSLHARRIREQLLLGLEQARDTCLPRVSVHRLLRRLVEEELDDLCPNALRLIAHPTGGVRVADAGLAADEPVLLAVGPEGGWLDAEVDLLQRHGFQRVSATARPLRTDTACIALLGLIHDARSGSPAINPPRLRPGIRPAGT